MRITLTLIQEDYVVSYAPVCDKSYVVTYSELGEQGVPGKSAYEIALSNGFVGTEQEWLDSGKYIRRHDYVANVSYCGYAPKNSLEDAPVWHISKIVVAKDGSTTTTTANNVKWVERLTINYN